MERTAFHIEELCCVDEERAIRKRLQSIDGIRGLSFDFLSRKMIVHHDGARHELADALQEIGFTCRLDVPAAGTPASRGLRSPAVLTLCSGIFLAIGLVLRFAGADDRLVAVALGISLLAGGWNIAGRAVASLRRHALDMNVLMTIAAIGAIAIGEYEEGAAVVFLFAVSHWLERNALERSRRRIAELFDQSAPTARRIREGNEEIIAVEQVIPGETIRIRPGEKIPLDGVVREGRSTVNQSAITGESRPREKGAGDTVFAGSVNERGALDVEVVRPHTESTLARIVHMVEEAQHRRAAIQTMAERFASIYTPAVMVLAVLTALIPPVVLGEEFGRWLYNALVMLVIACPCALVISTPVAILSALANASRHGILIKGGRHLEEVGRVRAIAFDKTGTLTSGLSRVTDIVPVDSMPKERLLQIAVAIEQRSEHPLAGAILRKAADEGVGDHAGVVRDFEALVGRGISASIDGDEYFAGNHALIEEKGICTPEVENILARLEGEGKAAIILAKNRVPLGIIAVRDTPRVESRAAIDALHAEGVEKVIMLTGDDHAVADALSKDLSVDEYHANLLPEEKLERVIKLRAEHGSVAMVGDGINDAPALAAATVGIAMGSAGTHAAMESADIVLMSDDLEKLPFLIRLSRSATAIIRQNMAIALATKLIFLGLAVFGHASLWTAILADDGAALIVIVNGLRALRVGSRA